MNGLNYFWILKIGDKQVRFHGVMIFYSNQKINKEKLLSNENKKQWQSESVRNHFRQEKSNGNVIYMEESAESVSYLEDQKKYIVGAEPIGLGINEEELPNND